jgi:hypothetical protein
MRYDGGYPIASFLAFFGDGENFQLQRGGMTTDRLRQVVQKHSCSFEVIVVDCGHDPSLEVQPLEPL